jgi:hypothetical protein
MAKGERKAKLFAFCTHRLFAVCLLPDLGEGFVWRRNGEFASIRTPRIQPPHEPLAPLRLVFESDGTKGPPIGRPSQGKN